MFNKEKNKIVMVHYGNVPLCPPVINVCECLVNNSIRVHLIGGDIIKLPEILLKNSMFSFTDLGDFRTSSSYINKFRKRKRIYEGMRDAFNDNMKKGDILWTTNEVAVMFLNKLIKPYQDHHILQLMELIDYCPVFYKFPIFKFPIDEYARKAWKTVVPEINRAHIQKIQWKQEKTPYVLPNKSYYLEPGEITDEVESALKIVKEEKRRIILYMGIFSPDRDMDSCIKAIDALEDKYCLYAIGRISDVMRDRAEYIINNTPNFKYLGFFNPPNHLHFLKYAHIGLTPYRPSYDIKYASPLNSLYCAPNKIFEYAGYGIPMIGTDVLGLRTPFEKFRIGICCKDLSVKSIVSAVQEIESQYTNMQQNCYEFYNSVNLDEIISKIIFE